MSKGFAPEHLLQYSGSFMGVAGCIEMSVLEIFTYAMGVVCLGT